MARGVPPQSALDEVEQDKKQMIVSSLNDLINMGKCETNTALRERIGMYFDLCASGTLRPGMSTLRLAIGVSRTTLYDWSVGNHCDAERAEIIRKAKDAIEAYVEQCMFQGQINPVSGIFLLKSYFGYNEAMNEEYKAFERAQGNRTKSPLTAAELPKLGNAMENMEDNSRNANYRPPLSAEHLPKLGDAE